MKANLRTKLVFFGITILMIICVVFSFTAAREIKFQHIIIDKDAIGHRKVGDINGDGYNDIVALNETGSGNILVWYKYPDWKKYTMIVISDFQDYTNYRSCDMELADIGGDNDLDVVGRIGKPNDDVEGVNCWFENPAPNGNPAEDRWKRHDIGESRYAKDLEIADFNNDGKLDIVSRALNAKLHIYFQKNKTLWEEIVLDITHHDGMDVGDIDRDGDPDIVLNGYWLETPENPLSRKWEKYDIDDKWYIQKTGNKGIWYDNNSKVKVVDMDEDGCLDVIISQAENKGFPVSWYEASADPKNGGWKEHVIGFIDYCHSLNAADMDNDGDIDIMTAEMPRYDEPYPVAVFINEGNALKWSKQELFDKGSYSAVIGDIGNDGDIDIVGLRCYNKAPIEIWKNLTSDNKLPLDKWTYIQVDDSRSKYVVPGGSKWWKYFGLAMGDLTGDGFGDIVSGKYFYRNPGGDMTGTWARKIFPVEVDAILIVDIDGDEYGDVIGQALPDVYWLEAKDTEGSSWNVMRIGTMPQPSHGNTQEYFAAQIIEGGKPEIVLGAADGISYFEIPINPGEGNWRRTLITSQASGLGIGDIDGDGKIDITSSDVSAGSKNRKIAWWKNPGSRIDNWEKFIIGSTDGFYPDRFAIADVNGDKRPEIIVTEEEQPVEPKWKTYWFEQPADSKDKNWQRHKLVTQHTTNAMDVADIDKDGDIDIITGEHRGTEKLTIWENNNKAKFWKPHIVSEGRESHLGARVFDLDGDGDLDIVSICLDDYQDLYLWRNDAVKGKTGEIISDVQNLNSSGSRKYYFTIEVNSGLYERYEKPVEININFTQLLERLDKTSAVDENSIQMIEVNSSGAVTDESIVFQFDKADDYNASDNALGTLIGTTPVNTSRYFRVYFDKIGGSYSPPSFRSRVSLINNIEYKSYQSLKISTQNAVYYYHKSGSGFAGMIDIDGNDWINYHPEGGSAGNYRGIPNIAPANFHPGPGEDNLESKIISQGPIKLKLFSETKDKKWGCMWEIFPDYAKMTLLKKGEERYWILYEGTPGGKLDVDTDYWVQSSGERFPVSKDWVGELQGPEWVYFGDGKIKRVLFLIHHEDDDEFDQFWQMQGNMTVFGFGRQYKCCDKYLAAIPAHLTIGFAEDSNFSTVSKVINSAYRELILSVGNPEVVNK